MAKDKVTVTLDPGVVAQTDADAEADGLNRSEYVEAVLRDAHYRRMLVRASAPPAGSSDEGLRALLAWQADPQGKAA